MARSQRSSTRSSWWDENSTVAPRGPPDEHLGEGVDGDRVEPGERLVEDEHVRVGGAGR
jgi:hypothetical protein